MSDDDKPHEYVPQLAIYNAQALGEKIALMDSLEVAEAERNNLAEALREVNARLVDVTAAKDFWQRQCDMAAKDHRAEMLVMGKERDAALDALAKAQAALDAARQSRKRLVALVAHFNELFEIYSHEFDFVIQERSSWRARAEQAEAERDAWQKIAQDTRDEAREYVSELRDLSEWKRGYPRYDDELARLDAFIAAMKDDLK